MRYYIDTEFSERGYDRIDLISIGMVSEDGREFYAVASDGWSPDTCNEWVRANILPSLSETRHRLSRAVIAHELIAFIGTGTAPEFWGYYCDYDWVLLCQLFGTMMDLPRGWPMFCLDVKQLAHSLGVENLPALAEREHHALGDARDIRYKHQWLTSKVPS